MWEQYFTHIYKLITNKNQMGLFSRTKEEIERNKKNIDLLSKVQELDLFMGSLEEYNKFKGNEYEIMDTNKRKKFVRYGPDSNELNELGRLMEEGCEALIHFIPADKGSDDNYSTLNHGTPIRRKREY